MVERSCWSEQKVTVRCTWHREVKIRVVCGIEINIRSLGCSIPRNKASMALTTVYIILTYSLRKSCNCNLSSHVKNYEKSGKSSVQSRDRNH